MAKTLARILLVDDDASLLKLLSMRLESAGYRVTTANSAEQALQLLPVERVDLVITDLRMGELTGMDLAERIQVQFPGLPVIIITAQGSISEAVRATQQGVFGFLTKPVDKDVLLEQVAAAIAQTGTAARLDGDQSWRSHILSRSLSMENLLDRARRVADSNVSVLITGDSGSGKELLAAALHKASARRDKPFIPINCGALPEPLLESELFGHVKGAFSGAVSHHLGLFRAADGGTLFLDEIGDMPLALQVKLLRVLQEREVRPVGSTETYPVNVRIISATHRNLDEEMKNGEFREDLYYRLNVVNLEVPGLTERREDIPLLANHFLKEAAAERSLSVRAFSPNAMNLLVAAAWPGNVRQLENIVQRTVALTHTPIISDKLVREALADSPPIMPSFTEARHTFERDYLMKLMKLTEGNVSQAARLAQRNRTDFYKLMQRHGLKAEQFKAEEG